ncbi:DUF4350 domain-containing protein [Uliginosibacterium paludis]|uniref:DUF4350 domain-containing protein n=1 Tax=Uliginosibacterium paludis TaxID=1615952 RepID=A0ABV2CPW9_9RHOO
MNRRWLKWLLILLVIAAGLGYVVRHLEWHEEQIRGKASAEALANPWHAGRLLLEASGIQTKYVRRAHELNDLPDRQTLMLTGLERLADPEVREPLLHWLQAGGHLVIPLRLEDQGQALLDTLGLEIRGQLPGGSNFLSEGNSPVRRLQVEQAGHDAILPGAVVFDTSLPADRLIWKTTLRGHFKDDDDDTFHPVEDASRQGQDPEDHLQEADSNEDLLLFARFRYGKGFVTTGGFEPFDNDHLDFHDDAALFLRLMTLPDGPRTVTMITLTPYDGLWRWLLEHAPEALFIAALMLAAWLRRQMPRFGPLLPEPLPSRPGLREHLAASGQYLLREGCHEALLAPLRESVAQQLDALAHRHPELESRERLGEHVSGIAAAEIRRALTAAPDSPHEFLRHARTLATLRQRCRQLARPSGVHP